jgi:hypothetical protein
MHRVVFAWAPASSLPAEQRGRVVARFCKNCSSFYPLFAKVHAGKPSFGKDHVSSTCACEGLEFRDGESWWEAGVEVLPAPVPQPAPATAGATP